MTDILVAFFKFIFDLATLIPDCFLAFKLLVCSEFGFVFRL